MLAAKALIEVQAGIIPGTPMPEYTRHWSYTSVDYAKDQNMPPDQPTILSVQLKEAHDYALGLSTPALNWVRLDWIWV